MEREVHPGEFYQHFKDKRYQIITVASHSETGEPMVVYQALYGDFKTYVRPLAMFLSEVDHEKYPDVKQKYRFERVTFGETAAMQPEAATEQAHAGLLRFLEADTYEERMAVLKELEKTAGQAQLDSIYLVLDMKPQAGTVPEQLEGIRRNLSMQKRYDGGHLR